MKPDRFELDRELVDDIRLNFSVEHVTEKLMETCAAMGACVGVKVVWHIESVDADKSIESGKLITLLSRLATLGGAFCLGGKINPIQALAQRERDVKKAQATLTDRKETNAARTAATK